MGGKLIIIWIILGGYSPMGFETEKTEILFSDIAACEQAKKKFVVSRYTEKYPLEDRWVATTWIVHAQCIEIGS